MITVITDNRVTNRDDYLPLAKAFAEDFGGTRDGQQVTVVCKQSLENIFMHYYGGTNK